MMLDQANFSMIQSQSRMEQEQKDMETLLSTFTESVVENQQNQNSVVPKKMMRERKDYSNTKVKTRNLLTNVSYRRFKQTDFNKKKLIVDIVSFLTQDFNPVNLDRKLDQKKNAIWLNFCGTIVFCMSLCATYIWKKNSI